MTKTPINLIWYLIILLPFTYLIGIAITEFFTLGLIIFFLFKNRKIIYFKEKQFIIIFLFSLYIGLNSIVQIDDRELYISSIFYFRFLIFSTAILFFFDNFENEIIQKKNILNTIFVILFIIFFDSLFQFFYGKNLLGFELPYDRVSSFFGSKLILGSFLFTVFPLFLWLIFFYKYDVEKNKFFLIFIFSLYLICIYLSGGRTSIVLTALYCISIIFFLPTIRKHLIFSIIFLFFFIFLTSIFNVGKANTFNRVFIKTFNQFTDQLYTEEKTGYTEEQLIESRKNIYKNIKTFSNDHHGHYILAYNLFKKKPFFGSGPEGFRYHCRSIKFNSKIGICSTHPHNFFFQLLSETGLLGIFFYISFLIFIIIKFFEVYKRDVDLHLKNCFLVISLCIFFKLFPLLPNGNFFNNWISITIYYFIGFYFYTYNKIFKE